MLISTGLLLLKIKYVIDVVPSNKDMPLYLKLKNESAFGSKADIVAIRCHVGRSHKLIDNKPNQSAVRRLCLRAKEIYLFHQKRF